MNWVDYAILIIVALSAIISIWRGLMRETLSLLGWIAAFLVAYSFYDESAVLLVNHIETQWVRHWAAAAFLFVGTLMVAGVANFFIGRLIANTGLTGTDRMLGVFFGIARGIAIVTALVLAAGFTTLPTGPWWQESLFVGHFQDIAIWVRDMLPENLAHYVNLGAEENPANKVLKDLAKDALEP